MAQAADKEVRVPPPAGSLVAGKYRVERLIGKGGMGAVVAAADLELGRTVAIKFLLPKFLSYPDIVARFVREARAAVRLKSEFAIRVIEVGRLNNEVPYIVMEHLEGQDLASVLARGPLTVSGAIDYVLQAGEAIAEAHGQGIIHRDLKPENLFLTHRADGSPAVKVLDFGISRFQDPVVSRVLTTNSDNIGSPLYMSPEQTESAKLTDERSDIWSLGVTLYELLAGTPPFNATTLPELVGSILTGEPKPLQESRPDIPRELAGLIHRCLEKDPDARFQDVAEFAGALAPYGSEQARVSAGRIARIPGVSLHPPGPHDEHVSSLPARRSHKFGLMVVAFAVAGALGVTAMVLLRTKTGPSDTNGKAPLTAIDQVSDLTNQRKVPTPDPMSMQPATPKPATLPSATLPSATPAERVTSVGDDEQKAQRTDAGTRSAAAPAVRRPATKRPGRKAVSPKRNTAGPVNGSRAPRASPLDMPLD